MAKSRGNRSSGNRATKSGTPAGGKGKGPGGLPSKTGNPSGRRRTNAPSRRKK